MSVKLGHVIKADRARIKQGGFEQRKQQYLKLVRGKVSGKILERAARRENFFWDVRNRKAAAERIRVKDLQAKKTRDAALAKRAKSRQPLEKRKAAVTPERAKLRLKNLSIKRNQLLQGLGTAKTQTVELLAGVRKLKTEFDYVKKKGSERKRLKTLSVKGKQALRDYNAAKAKTAELYAELQRLNKIEVNLQRVIGAKKPVAKKGLVHRVKSYLTKRKINRRSRELREDIAKASKRKTGLRATAVSTKQKQPAYAGVSTAPGN
ncbi:MAG: hypothetical protein V1494_06755 [Candidatus Diapherotrites archaeon]